MHADLHRELIPKDFNVNELHPQSGARYIDFAAQSGNLNALMLLINEYQADLSMRDEASHTHLFYWLLQCKNAAYRSQIIDWLKKTQNYSMTNCGVSSRHIEALTIKNFKIEQSDQADVWGLLPCHYFILGNVTTTDDEKLEYIENNLASLSSPMARLFKGINFTFLLSRLQMDFLIKLSARHSTFIFDLNQKLGPGNYDAGASLAMIFAEKEIWLILETQINRQPDCIIDLNAKFENPNHLLYGITLAGFLASLKKWERLEKLIDRQPESIIDVNAKFENPNHRSYGISLAGFLASQRKWEGLEKLIDHQPKFIIDLNAKPENRNHLSYGITLAEVLVSWKKWEMLGKLIDRQPDSMIDLNAKPENPNHPHYGISAGQLMVHNKKYALLENILKKNVYKIELNKSMLNKMLSDGQYSLLLDIFEKTNQKISLHNTQAIQKLCRFCINSDRSLSFLQAYDHEEFQILLNHEKMRDYMYIYEIDKIYKFFSTLDLSQISKFQENMEDFQSLFLNYQNLKDEKLKKNRSLKIVQALQHFKELFKDSLNELQTLTQKYPSILYHVSHPGHTIHAPLGLPISGQFAYEIFRLLPRDSPEGHIYFAQMLGNLNNIKAQNTMTIPTPNTPFCNYSAETNSSLDEPSPKPI